MVVDNSFFVSWRHVNGNFTVRNQEVQTKATQCLIKDKNDEVVCVGEAVLSPGDNFSRNIGRRLSMKKALTELKLTKEEKANFWNQYYQMRNNKW